ncbi:MAG: sn-glycerol-3-phosphate ABC transporter ATP-binding protein UgpC [Spartobacteria bacterium]|nr:sn-glycerol-3-phosphate ABC transporter ATP-binding protein UgpC [Spartobacteria bacterium]
MGEVRLENVCKTYPGNVTVVHDVNLTVQDREFMVLVGPSGCGKSTTLRMIAGLEEISSGKCLIDGQEVNDTPPKDRNIAMVFQNYALYPHMTVYKNMAYGLKMRNYPKDEIDKRVREAAEILGITQYLDRRPKALSGGQRQRVAVGRAIVRKPRVFLFDEPLSNLDAKMRVQMRTEISKLHRKLQATIIYVTHDQVEAMTMGTRITVMKDGVIQQVATPLELFKNPANQFVAGFIGSPQMNFFEGYIEKKPEGLFFTEGNFSVLIDDAMNEAMKSYTDKPVVLGVRPSDVHPAYENDKSNHAAVDARVDVIEMMGDESYVYMTTGRHNFIAKVAGDETATVDKVFHACFDMKKVHFFDKETSLRI